MVGNSLGMDYIMAEKLSISLKRKIEGCICFYSMVSPHSTLDDRIHDEVYFNLEIRCCAKESFMAESSHLVSALKLSNTWGPPPNRRRDNLQTSLFGTCNVFKRELMNG
jgi:hypothetical protein